MRGRFQSTRPVRGATLLAAGEQLGPAVSIHAPRAGRDQLGHLVGRREPQFQSTRPVRGATAGWPSWGPGSRSFNPRAPCGARHGPRRRLVHGRGVSIHAPRAGRDHPPRGSDRSRQVSIHAPRAGRDRRTPWSRPRPRSFNPRAPCGARRGTTAWSRESQTVSIHAPRAGRDRRGPPPAVNVVGVSIHAPRAGRDCWTAWGRLPRKSFNPRAPCGARQSRMREMRDRCGFQSTRPVRGATSVTTRRTSSSTSFNPRAPCGARPWAATSPGATATVSIHAPRAGRDEAGVRAGRAEQVSIHAPRTGRDHATASLGSRSRSFQSTRPVRGATR